MINGIFYLLFIHSAGYYANEQVQGYILLPLIDLLMSTPASLTISKVSELELLTVLARHDHHKEGGCLKWPTWIFSSQYKYIIKRKGYEIE